MLPRFALENLLCTNQSMYHYQFSNVLSNLKGDMSLVLLKHYETISRISSHVKRINISLLSTTTINNKQKEALQKLFHPF